jgi:hypothetical protein
MVERVKVAPPRSRMGPVKPEERQETLATSPLAGKYEATVDRESAYEILQGRATTVAEDVEPHSPWGGGPAPRRNDGNPWGVEPGGVASRRIGGRAEPAAPRRRAATREAPPPAEGGLGGLLGDLLTGGGGRRQSPAEAMLKSAMRSVGSNVGRQVGNAIVRGVRGSIMKR